MGSPLLKLDPEAGDLADPAMSLHEQLVVLALLLRLVSLALLLRLVSLALLLRLVLLALVLLPSVLLVPPWPSVSAPWRRLEDVRLPHQSTAEGRDMLTAMMTRAVCQHRTLWG